MFLSAETKSQLLANVQKKVPSPVSIGVDMQLDRTKDTAVTDGRIETDKWGPEGTNQRQVQQGEVWHQLPPHIPRQAADDFQAWDRDRTGHTQTAGPLVPVRNWPQELSNTGTLASPSSAVEYWRWVQKQTEERYELIKRLQKIEAIEQLYREQGWEGNPQWQQRLHPTVHAAPQCVQNKVREHVVVQATPEGDAALQGGKSEKAEKDNIAKTAQRVTDIVVVGGEAQEEKQNETGQEATVDDGWPEVILQDPDSLAQQEALRATGVYGRVLGKPAERKELETAIFRACGSHPVGVSQYKQGKFLAIMRDGEMAKKLMGSRMRIAGRAVIMRAWDEDGRGELDRLDVALYWVKLPGLPLQFYESLEKIYAVLSLGQFVSVETPKTEVANGAPPIVCVQIADSDPLPRGLKLTRVTEGSAPKRWLQLLEYADMLHKCDRCKRQGHTHRQCAGEYVLDVEEENPTWAQRVRKDPPRETQKATRTVEIVKDNNPKAREGRTEMRSARDVQLANLAVYRSLFPEAPEPCGVTFKVSLMSQQWREEIPELWVSHDRGRLQYPMKMLEGSRLWGKTRRQQEEEACKVMQELLLTICTRPVLHNQHPHSLH